MTTSSPTPEPIAQDFEALVEQLPYWVRETYYPSVDIINRVRKVLEVHDKIIAVRKTSGTNIGA